MTGPVCDLPADDFFMSLNGFDEIAITKAFGADVAALRDEPFRFLRALVFVHQRRADQPDKLAYHASMTLTVEALQDYFPDPEPDDLDPDDPDTDQGKDGPPSE